MKFIFAFCLIHFAAVYGSPLAPEAAAVPVAVPVAVPGQPEPAGFEEVDFEDENVRQARSEYDIEEYLALCDTGYEMVAGKSVKFQSPYYGKGKYPPNIKCGAQFIGSEKCTVEVTCKVDLAENDECTDEYLAISDGLGGRQAFCGKTKPDGAISPSRGRDLYLDFASSAATGKGFSCEAKCGKSGKKLEVTMKKKEEFRCVCGIQNKDDRIVGGQDAAMGEFPWLIAVVYHGTRMPMCGGAVINDRTIMTAAHCFWFEKMQPDAIDVLYHARVLDLTLQEGWKNVSLGQKGSIQGSGFDKASVTDEEEKTQRFEVEEIINHPLFNPDYDYDVALLKLKKKIKLDSQDAPTPICLPPDESYKTTYDGAKPTVSGWGKPHGDAASTTKVLQKLEVPTIPLKKCQGWMGDYTLTPRMVCAGYEEGGKDACTGDSGGPLFLKTATKQFHQIGIVSWGEGCALKHRPGLYSRVTELSQWVQYHTAGATWCRYNKGS